MLDEFLDRWVRSVLKVSWGAVPLYHVLRATLTGTPRQAWSLNKFFKKNSSRYLLFQIVKSEGPLISPLKVRDCLHTELATILFFLSSHLKCLPSNC